MVMQKANSSHDGFGFGVIEMAVIPSQEIIDPMNSGYGNMLCIVQCLGRVGGHSLTATTFADDAHGLAGVDAEADAVERPHYALVAGDAHA